MRSLIRSRRFTLPLAALALAVTGVAAYGAVADDGVDYRTVRATTGSVEQQLSLSGVISPEGSSELAFGTDGKVAEVGVEPGEKVAEGDTIAVLDRSTLRAAVHRAGAGLASAKAQLADDRDAQTSAVTTSTSVPSSTGDSSSGSASAARATPSGSSGSARADGSKEHTEPSATSGQESAADAALVKQITAEQDAVLSAQTTASEALAAADTALADQQAACADPVTRTETTTDPDEGAGGGEAGDEEPEGGTGGTVTTTAVLSEACTAALAAVQAAQTTAAQAQATLQSALDTLSGTLTEALGSVLSGGPSSGGSTGSSGSDGSSGSGDQTPASGHGSSAPSAAGTPSAGSPAALPSSGSGAGAQQPVTAATLAQDQAAIDRASADLAAAKADLAGAIVRAPADGTIGSLAVTPGDSVSAGDTVAIVVAPGLTTVTVQASATQAAQLEQGMSVEVTPAGADRALAGSISRVEHLPSSDSSTDPSYAVQIVLDEGDLRLADGMPASVTVVVGAAEDVVVVPASAVTNESVTLLENGAVRRVRVTTGVVGATEVEVSDGVAEGDVVVLADLGADLPTGDGEPRGFRVGPGGGGDRVFPGGGRRGGMVPRR